MRLRVTGPLWRESIGDQVDSPHKVQAVRNFGVFFALSLHKLLNKQSNHI